VLNKTNNLLKIKIDKSFERLTSPEYGIERVFQRAEYDWPGDWEGRALLAFCSHYGINGRENPCMHAMVANLKSNTNSKYYFGKEYDSNVCDEQQLSGHSWYLCGLVEYYKYFNDSAALEIAKSTVENLFLPISDKYQSYPVIRDGNGGVSGNIVGQKNGWRLSSDVGCAFMCVDGLSRYYSLTMDERVKDVLDKLIGIFTESDYVANGFQTHTSLSCARGILGIYNSTSDKRYLEIAIKIFGDYVNYGMTQTYENFNWFGREDTWTEPCAIVDSLILSVGLYKATGEEWYKTLARRIWFNGLSFCQRDNGGAGPNTCVTKQNPVLKISMYEAPFCCTMRYAEGLLCASQNSFVTEELPSKITKEVNRYFYGDKLLAEDLTGVFKDAVHYEIDGRSLIGIPTLISQEMNARLRIIFD